ncbi:MAG: RNA-binding protein [Pseudomonadota bacterium]
MDDKLFVGNIPYDFSEDDLKSIFDAEQFKVVDVKLITDRITGKSRGFGFVTLETDELAAEAVKQYNGKEVGGRTLKIEVAKGKQQKDGGERKPRAPRNDYPSDEPQEPNL